MTRSTYHVATSRQSQPDGDFHASRIVVATRGSALAMWQTNWVVSRLAARAGAPSYVIEQIKTLGDRSQAQGLPFNQLDGKSVFVAELEHALLEGSADLAVHSLKDMASTLPGGLALAAVTKREDPRDALIARNGGALRDLPDGARVATSSLRRRAQLLHLRPDLRIEEMRGNADTRIRKALDPGGPDAVVLAAAGLHRLGLEHHITEYLDPEVIVPAAGQAALAVEARRGDTALRRLARAVDDAATRRAAVAERAVLRALGGGCRLPLGAYARHSAQDMTLRLIAVVGTPDGSQLVRVEAEGPAARPAALGRHVAALLREQGAEAILRGVMA